MSNTIKILDKLKHRYFRYSQMKSFSFAKSMDLIPITYSEVKQLCCLFPIVIAEIEGKATLAILAKEIGGSSTAIKGNGLFTGKYIPAFLRRYPFVWVKKDTENEEVHLGFENEIGYFDSPYGERLFDDEGNPTKTLERITALMRGIEGEMKITQNILQALKDRGIIEPSQITRGEGDDAKTLTGFSVISREKLNEQDDAFLVTTVKNGWMEIIELQLFSLRHLKVAPL